MSRTISCFNSKSKFNKLILVLFIALTVTFFADTSKIINASDNGYIIDDFKSFVDVNKDTTIKVKEVISVDFNEQRHGIYRIIPTTYSVRGKTVKTKLTVFDVTDEKGVSYIYKIDKHSKSLTIRIGDPNLYLTGKAVYVINYSVSDTVRRYENHDELYWNVTGSDWDTAILGASLEVKSIFADIIDTACFSGDVGGHDQNCVKEIKSELATIRPGIALGNGKDFTAVVGFNKKNDLIFPTFIENLLSILFDNWGYIFSLIPLLTMIRFWYKYGRDVQYEGDNVYYRPDNVKAKTVSLFSRKHIPFVYHPIDGLTPAEIGTIFDERVNIKDVVSEVIELARLGYIQIQKIVTPAILKERTDYAFIDTHVRKNKSLDDLKDYQKYLYKELFRKNIVHDSVDNAEKLFKENEKELESVRKELIDKNYILLSALKNHFYISLPEFKKKLYKRMKEEGFFYDDPERVRVKWIAITLMIEAIFFIAVAYFITITGNVGPLILLLLLSFPLFFITLSMPKRAPKGYSLYRQIRGLKYYINKGKWRYDIQEKNMFFEEMLPLAIALGVTDKLTDAMKQLDIAKPDYLGGSSWINISSDLSAFQASTVSAFVSTPHGNVSGSWSGGSGFSGGGGSSGGGFGGGGGGSW